MHLRNLTTLTALLVIVSANAFGFDYNRKNVLPSWKASLGVRINAEQPYLPLAYDVNLAKYLGGRFYLGINFGGLNSHIGNSFGYATNNPVLGGFDVGLVPEYTVVCNPDFKLYFNVFAGVSSTNLYDGDVYHYRKLAKVYDKDLAHDTYHAIKPGVMFQYNYGYIKIAYSLLQGGTTQFANRNDFKGLQITVGLCTN